MTNPQYFVAVQAAEEMPEINGNYYTNQGELTFVAGSFFQDEGRNAFVRSNAGITHWLRPAPEVEAMQAQMERMRNALEAVLPILWDGDPRRQADCPYCRTITSALEAGKIEKPSLPDTELPEGYYITKDWQFIAHNQIVLVCTDFLDYGKPRRFEEVVFKGLKYGFPMAAVLPGSAPSNVAFAIEYTRVD